MMNKTLRIAGNFIFGLNILLVFFLLFGDQMVFPTWLQTVGRMHPFLLHLPIGLVLVYFALGMVKRSFEPGPYQDLMKVTLYTGALLAALTALMGLVLAAEGGYDDDALNAHRISGSMLSLLSAGVIAVSTYWPSRMNVTRIMLAVNVVVLLVAGHLGGTLTHGENYIFAPLVSRENPETVVTDSTTFFTAAIQPIFERKCVSCHNANKSKGGLVLTSLQDAAKGGEHGELWKVGNANGSMLVKRIMLPEHHKEHMPPSGKPQLSILEARLIYQWINEGADTLIALRTMEPADSLRRLAELAGNISLRQQRSYRFEFASADLVEALNDPFLTVNKLSLNEPALAATFFISKEYKRSKLENLLKVKEQLVELNLSAMPITDDDCALISRFTNLEKLTLNFTPITTDGLKQIVALPQLRSLALAGTPLDKDAMLLLKNTTKLAEVFIWNTPASSSVDDLAAVMPDVKWNTGYVPNESEVLRLTPPLLLQEKSILYPGDSIVMTHKLPGTTIRYTTDGTAPDSVNGTIFGKAINVKSFTMLKAITCKTGWYCSAVATYTFFAAGITPDSATLLTPPDKSYRGYGSATLIDNIKGYADNHRDKTWLGYRGNALSSVFYFSPKEEISNITVSYLRNTGGFLFPPMSVEVWSGDDAGKLSLIKRVQPDQPKQNQPAAIAAVEIPIDRKAYPVLKVIVHPLPELPKWHPANNKNTKDKRAWVFVDEIFFY